MTQFNVFDQARLLEFITLTNSLSNALNMPQSAAAGVLRTIVEVLEPGETFLVELFGDWVTLDQPDGLRRATAQAEGAFRETIGVEVLHPQQMTLLKHSNPVLVGSKDYEKVVREKV